MKDVDFLVHAVLADIKKPKKLNENVLDYPKKELCKDVWTKEEKLKPEVKRELMRRFEKWRSKVAPDLKINKWYILGSIATYQYNGSSDLDVNLLVNYSKEKIAKIWTTLPNGNEISGHPVNFYLSADRHDIDQSKAAYDFETDEWEKHPSKGDTTIPAKYSLEIAKFFMDGIDLRISEYERDKQELEKLQQLLKSNDSDLEDEEIKRAISEKEEEVKADVDSIKLAHYVLKSIRKEGFAGDEHWKFQFGITISQDNDPNKSLNNLIYKQLEQFKYFNKIEKIEKEND